MSSSAYLNPAEPIKVDEWVSFCIERSIDYSPRTVGRNVFYCVDAEIHFGEARLDEDPYLPGSAHTIQGRVLTGGIDVDAIQPPVEAQKLSVSTFYLGRVERVAEIARAICERFNCKYRADPELESLMEDGSFSSFVDVSCEVSTKLSAASEELKAELRERLRLRPMSDEDLKDSDSSEA